MRAYVINLARRPDRLSRIKVRLDQCCIKWTVISAIDAEDLGQLPPGTLVTPAEAACWLSHQRMFEHFLSTEEDFGLALEDDAVPDPSLPWPLVLTELQDFMSQTPLDYLQIGTVGVAYRSALWRRLAGPLASHSAHCTARVANRKLGVILGASSAGTHAYIFSRAFAQNVIHLNNPVWVGADGFYDRLATAMRLSRVLKMGRLIENLAVQESRASRASQIDSDVLPAARGPYHL
mgnify:CR=1 FL=1